MNSCLDRDQMKALKGECLGCVHAKGKEPGKDNICSLCIRNAKLEDQHECCLTPDRGKKEHGARDCYVARDRFDMDLAGITFFKGMEKQRGR